MSARAPLPVETLVAVTEPVARSELFTWLRDEAGTKVPVIWLPPGPFKVTGPPGMTVLRVLEVPSTLTTPSTPAVGPAMADRPRVARALPPVTCRLWLEP